MMVIEHTDPFSRSEFLAEFSATGTLTQVPMEQCTLVQGICRDETGQVMDVVEVPRMAWLIEFIQYTAKRYPFWRWEVHVVRSALAFDTRDADASAFNGRKLYC